MKTACTCGCLYRQVHNNTCSLLRLPQLPPTLKAVPVTQNSIPSSFSSQLGCLLLFVIEFLSCVCICVHVCTHTLLSTNGSLQAEPGVSAWVAQINFPSIDFPLLLSPLLPQICIDFEGSLVRLIFLKPVLGHGLQNVSFSHTHTHTHTQTHHTIME
jgi:hypothetical protein